MKFNRWLIPAGLSLLALVGACIQIAPVAVPRLDGRTNFDPRVASSLFAEATPTAVPVEPSTDQLAASLSATATASARAAATATPNPLANRQVAVVARGPVSETIQLGGRVSPVSDAPLAFSIRGTVDNVAVQPGQAVAAGQLMVTLDSVEARHQLQDLGAEVEITRARQQQLNDRLAAQLQASQEAAARANQVNQARVADATAKAQEQLRLAQANLDKVQAGPSPVDRLAADQAVTTARATLAKADSDLSRLTGGPTAAERRAADEAVNTAQAALTKAQIDHDKLVQPPSPAEVADAKAAVAAAHADLERARTVDTSSNAAKISDAERQRRQEAADFALNAARARLDAMLHGPDKDAVNLATMTMDNARSELASAQAKVAELMAPPEQAQVEGARQSVESARLGLAAAEAARVEVNSHPTDEELRVAQKQVDDAQTALERAAIPPVDSSAQSNDKPASTETNVDSPAVLRMTLQHTLEQQYAQIQSLNEQLAASQLVAPRDGVVESISVKAGESSDPGRVVLVLASPEPPVVTANVSDADAARLTLGTETLLRLEASSDQIKGRLASVEQSPGGQGHIVRVDADWPEDNWPSLGAGAQATVVVNHKDDALLIPQRAVRSSGERRVVDLVDGGQRRTIDVKIGIDAGDIVEVLSGLEEGQTVLLPN
jgi:RND family efflux transporter MFP subunit